MSEKIKFARFGGLSPVVQKGYTTNPKERGFHTPPARKGFYAFIWPYYEFFLLGGTYSKLGTGHAKFEYLRDDDGKKIEYDADNPLLKKYLIQGKTGKFFRDSGIKDVSWKIWEHNGYAVVKKTPRVFTHTGELWHHLDNKAVKPFEIIDSVMAYDNSDGSTTWIKTEYDVFVKAFERDKSDCINQLRNSRFSDFKTDINVNKKNVYNFISRDHLEVFIERVK